MSALRSHQAREQPRAVRSCSCSRLMSSRRPCDERNRGRDRKLVRARKELAVEGRCGAFAGGLSWQFPCGSSDRCTHRGGGAAVRRLEQPPGRQGARREHPHRPQRKRLVRRRLESFPGREEQSDNASVCAAMILDVKVTEDNSFPLAQPAAALPRHQAEGARRDSAGRGPHGTHPGRHESAGARERRRDLLQRDDGQPDYGDVLAVKYFVKNPAHHGPARRPTGLDGQESRRHRHAYEHVRTVHASCCERRRDRDQLSRGVQHRPSERQHHHSEDHRRSEPMLRGRRLRRGLRCKHLQPESSRAGPFLS